MIVIVACMALISVIGVGAVYGAKNNSGRLVKVSSEKLPFSIEGVRAEFDFESVMNGNKNVTPLVFSGDIAAIEEYESSWIDSDGIEWGPFARTIITVNVDKWYREGATTPGKIKILYVGTLNTVARDELKIVEGGNYIFVNCWAIDDKYRENSKDLDGEPLNDPAVKEADAIMGGEWNSLIKLDAENAMLYNGIAENLISSRNDKIDIRKTGSDNSEYCILDRQSLEKCLSEYISSNRGSMK